MKVASCRSVKKVLWEDSSSLSMSRGNDLLGGSQQGPYKYSTRDKFIIILPISNSIKRPKVKVNYL